MRISSVAQRPDWYYPIGDQLTSTNVVVDFSGVIAVQLFGPYGQLRWSGGTMPTTYAFTGQHSDSATGLDYYNARYYDPAAGTFTSADAVLPGKGFSPAGLNRYAYVADNPETATDPTGHFGTRSCADGMYCGSVRLPPPIQGNPPPAPPPPIQGNPPPLPIPPVPPSPPISGGCTTNCHKEPPPSPQYDNPCGTQGNRI